MEMFPFCFESWVIWLAGRSLTLTHNEAGLLPLLPPPDSAFSIVSMTVDFRMFFHMGELDAMLSCWKSFMES